MYIIFNVESVALKKSKSLRFVSKEKFLMSDGVKSNEENMMKAMTEFSFLMEVRMKVYVVFWWFFKQKFFEKK